MALSEWSMTVVTLRGFSIAAIAGFGIGSSSGSVASSLPGWEPGRPEKPCYVNAASQRFSVSRHSQTVYPHVLAAASEAVALNGGSQ
jgi:hypothetical protein